MFVCRLLILRYIKIYLNRTFHRENLLYLQVNMAKFVKVILFLLLTVAFHSIAGNVSTAKVVDEQERAITYAMRQHGEISAPDLPGKPIGKQHLASWFNAHLENKEAIEHRQEAIHELSTDLEYRQQIRLLGLLYKGKPADTTEIKEWANSPSYYRKRTLLRILPTAVTIINFLCIGLAILGIISASIAGGVFVGFVLFSTIFSKGITKLQTTYGEKLQILSTYADQILLTEQKEMQSHILQKLKTELTSQNQTASQAVRQLSKLMNALDQRSNLLISTILNGLIFWELRQVMRIEKWKEIHASDLPRWIETIGEIDAYCSLATFAYNHPDYIYPTIAAQSFHLQAEALGHPLMDRNKCVRNGINIERRPFFIIITGANMAGKSTYLRTVGVN